MTDVLLDLSVDEKSFLSHRVIDAIRFAVPGGEIVSLVGPSGCGKSTLLRIVAGLDTQYCGTVRIKGAPPQVHSPDVGLIFQEPRLMPWLTVAENIGFELGRLGDRHPRVKELLAEVGLAGFPDAYPKQLSGGMAQRTAIARGLLSRPALLLLDEPFSAVDAFTRMRLQDLILALAARHGTTLLLVTHDIAEAVYVSDRVIVMASEPGRVTGEVRIDLARPRERRHPQLAAWGAQVLTLLNGGTIDYLDLTDELAAQTPPGYPIATEHLAFAL
ncbi:ABC transporter ATP-binding protein [uncultured Thiodictyon sp.]|uniref:ABC transporter ATP-binding protein n=1 Tax=uncultured Thiodictyon sp. TaxID=1846217 RepID=UPI0025E3D745|nr:ABC transporter ATP-binding protein [uncultured Thiodictyon sp.]